MLTFVNRKCGITHARFLPLRSAGFGDEKGGAAVHDAGGLLRGLSALEEGVRFVEDDGQDLLIAAGAAVHMLQYVHEVRRDGFVKQEGLRPGLADVDAAFFADGSLLIGLLRVDLQIGRASCRERV